MFQPAMSHGHLPWGHETNATGSWSQGTNGTILEVLGRNLNGLLEQLRRRNHESYEPSGCHFAWRCIQATLTNTSCPASWRAADLLYGLWSVRCEGGRHVKVPGHRNQRESGIPGTTEPLWWGSHRQERPRLLVTISSTKGPLPQATVVPQYHLSASQSVAEIRQLLGLFALWTQQGENSLRSLISLNLKRCINP